MAFSLQRESSKLRNAARRLRKKGYSGEAGKMMAASEMARMREPNIMTPEFRRAEATSQMALRNAQLAASSPDFDPVTDIQPLRQQFFRASALLPMGQQSMVTSKFGSQMDAITQSSMRDESARKQMRAQDLAFQASQRKFKEDKRQLKQQRKLEKALPDVGKRLENIIQSVDPPEQKQKKILSEAFSNPKLYALPAAASALGSAMGMVQGQEAKTKRKEERDTDLSVIAARLGATDAIDLIKQGNLGDAIKIIGQKVEQTRVDELSARGLLRRQGDVSSRFTKFTAAVKELVGDDVAVMTPSEIANKLTEGKTQLLATDRELIAEFDALIKILNNLAADKTISDSISEQINQLIQRAVASLGPNRAMQSAAPVRNVRSETGL
jgi:hypothetical protein